MSVKTNELIQIINTYAPRELEEDWDNSGWQINLCNTDVTKLFLTLEITNKVIDEAIDKEADFILTHHPLIFKTMNVIDCNDVRGNHIAKLIKSGISVYSTHTSFDSAFGGINDDLAERVGLFRVRKLHTHNYSGEREDIIGRMGEYEVEKTLKEVCDIVKETLDIDRKLFVIGDTDTKIKKVAVCGGASGDAIPKIINHCDLLITGDVKHHEGQIANESGLCVINAGHFATEKYFVENMGEKLRSQIDDKLDIIESEVDMEAFKLL